MPGLINKENRTALPLSVSDITSCVRGYTLAMTASMTYENIEDHAIEGEYSSGVIARRGLPQLGKQTMLTYTDVLFLCCCPAGIFIYPMEENAIVVGFEAMISTQIITLQIKDKAKIEDCHLDCCNTQNGALQSCGGI